MDTSSFSVLSPELRNLIYEFTFYNQYSTTLQTSKIQHPLTKCCRQLRQETLGLYYSCTRYNAHLDDGPATPLATWLKAIGREQCLLLDEVNIWDIHMLNATVHGDEVAKRLLASRTSDGRKYVLQPVGSWLLNRGWYLKDIVLALHSMDLSLARLCLASDSAKGEAQLGLTSHFAIVPSSAEQTEDEGHALETLCAKLDSRRICVSRRCSAFRTGTRRYGSEMRAESSC
ncbi:hypothetical protein EJ03DRAFT_101705 [Teratosphaeria nubilosa]|uniref:F-box domain-containing protein n=1 Tax=Teratosphaeria nubilosa TaxID=161662 RepID=A0A6G1LL21_9PEZI|nr:hypothetical protein EJ03DRAFT_101705 [Teratosphaeria nubilosa]